ncbi:MAG TPA: hypothetical protein DEP23_00775 [Ruminococcaceae bacterium]|nr:hypothetical protein [Oscillospiraceae bacterium]
MAAPIAVAVKKALEVLASNKKGRKFLGYVIGITLFLIMLPFIVLYGLFGWMNGTDNSFMQTEQIMSALPAEQQEQLKGIDSTYQKIAEIFSEKELTENDAKKAQEIYVGLLIGKEENDNFYDDLVWCFQNATDESSLYDNLLNKFSVSFTEKEKQYLDEKYGVTIVKSSDTSGSTDPNSTPAS